MNTKKRPIRFSQSYELIPQKLPCIYFRESHSIVAHDLPFGGEVEDSTIYIEVYSTTNCEPMVKEIEELMSPIGYNETNCTLVDNADPTIERVSMVFNRVISRGDTI